MRTASGNSRSVTSAAVNSWKSLYPFEGHTMSWEGLRLHYLDEGQGEPLVMLHGNPTWSFLFRDLVRELRPSWRCIVPDYIGCGLSEKPGDEGYVYTLENRVREVEALLDHLGLTRNLTLVAHDWGGLIGTACVLRRLERFSRVVLMNTAAFLRPAGKRIPWRLRLAHHRGPISDFLVRRLNLFCRGAARMATTKGLSREARAGLLAPYDSFANRIAIQRFVQDIPLRPTDRSYALTQWVDHNLHRLTQIPLLICWGRRDFVFDEPVLREWQRRLPDVKYAIYPDAGHYVLDDAGAEVLEAVQGFLAQHPLAPAAATATTGGP